MQSTTGNQVSRICDHQRLVGLFPRLFDQSSAIELPVRCLWSNLASNSVSSSPIFRRAPGELRFQAQDGVNRLDLDWFESAHYFVGYFLVSQLLLVPIIYCFTRIDWHAAFTEKRFKSLSKDC
jgi:hypothetical protein